jgi:hypothetical protein
MKIQLLKVDTKETFGESENSFDYWHRPLTVEEKYRINSRTVWKKEKDVTTVDSQKTELAELVRLAVTRIDRLYDSDDAKIDTIDKLLSLKAEAGFLDGVIASMWYSIWISMSLSEELKKKLLQDSTQLETK